MLQKLTTLQPTRAMIRSVLLFLVAPVAASAALIMGGLHIAAYTGPDLRQFDPEVAMELRIFGVAVLSLAGFYLAARWIAASRARKVGDHASS